MNCTYRYEFTVQVVRQVLQHRFDVRGVHLLDLLLDRGCSQAQDVRAFAFRAFRVELVVEEVPHDQIIQVVLVGMVALVKYYNRYFLHFDEAVHQ